MFLALLLQAAAATVVNQPLLPSIGVEIVLFVLGNLGFVWAFITWKIARADKATADRQKDKDDARAAFEKKHDMLSQHVATHEMSIQQHQIEFDKAKAAADTRYQLLNQKVAALEPLPGKVVSLENKFEMITEQMKTMKDDMKEIKSDLKVATHELRSDIKDLGALIQNHFAK
ncbi:hypothetical protein [Hymenobacter siberiensis]|uniref:hypothetical protein n=1 Tax=Hymenobacter siberiensis TaxID=2848396 RepID=UPI001C1E4536|nr:hypothetical protein [Hymenobacter siberiensis]